LSEFLERRNDVPAPSSGAGGGGAPAAAAAAPAAAAMGEIAGIRARARDGWLMSNVMSLVRREKEAWKNANVVRAVVYFFSFSLVLTVISMIVDSQTQECTVPVAEWLTGHLIAWFARVVVALLIFVMTSLPGERFLKAMRFVSYASHATDVGIVLVAVVGLSYMISTSDDDCPSLDPYRYRALALLVTLETGGAALSVLVLACGALSGWARRLRMAQQANNANIGNDRIRNNSFMAGGAVASLGASSDEIQRLPLRRFKRAARQSMSDLASKDLVDDGATLRPASPAARAASPGVSACAVCLCEYEPRDLVRVLPCHHYFHRQCIEPWLERNKTCALCKHAIDQPAPGSFDNALATKNETVSTDEE